jgi:hypothetical protein
MQNLTSCVRNYSQSLILSTLSNYIQKSNNNIQKHCTISLSLTPGECIELQEWIDNNVLWKLGRSAGRSVAWHSHPCAALRPLIDVVQLRSASAHKQVNNMHD